MLHRVDGACAAENARVRRRTRTKIMKNLRPRRPNLLQIFHDPGARRANFAFLSPKIQFFKSQDLGAAPMRLGTVLSAKKARVRRGDCASFSPENAHVRLQIFRSSTRNAPNLRPASLRNFFDVAEMLHRVDGACVAENARVRRRIRAKICVDDA